MAQNITSLLELKARQDELPDDQKPVLSVNGLMYFVNGLGSGRDTVFTIEEFLNFIGAEFKAHTIHYLGNMESEGSSPKVGGWKVYTSTDITEASFGYGQLVFQFQNPSGNIPHTKGPSASIVVPGLIVQNESTFVDIAEFKKNVKFDKNVVVEEDFSAKNVETDSIKINTAIDVNSAYIALTSSVASVGDIVILHNVYSSDVTVEVHVVRDPTSGWATAKWNTTLKQRSSMMLRCVAIHTINDVKSYEWSPLCNSEVTVNVLM